LEAQLAGSLLSGGAPDVQRDGTVLRDGSSGAAASLKVSKEGGPVVFFAQADRLSPGFTTNDLGFMRRANLTRLASFVNLRDVHPSEKWQSARVGFGAFHVRNAAFDVPLQSMAGGEFNVTLNSFWYFAGGLYAETRHYDDRELRDGTPFERPGLVDAYVGAGSDSRRDLFAELTFEWIRGLGRFYGQISPGATIKVRPLAWLETQLDLSLLLRRGDVRSIRSATAPSVPGSLLDPATAAGQERVYLFAPQDSRTLSTTLRGTYAFSPRLTLQAYAQFFTAGVSYGAPLRYLAGPGRSRIHLDDLSPALPQDDAPNADERQAGLNVNLILRWEWTLGSTLYLVYTHATGADLLAPPARGLDFGRELGAFTDRAATHGDTFLIKIDFFKAL
jgi:Domain of unknown function (DUF5916)